MKPTAKLGRPRVLIVGCGDVGLRCVPLLNGRFRVLALIRDVTRGPAVRAAGAQPVRADLDQRRSLDRLARLAPYILHLAPPAAVDLDDTRTRHLLAALGAGQARRRAHAASLTGRLRRRALSASRIVPERRSSPDRPVLAYGSTSGVYGDCGGALVLETRPPRPANARAVRRLAAETRLRQAGKRGGISLRIIRIPGIYAAERLPLARLQRGTPALRTQDDVYTSHIHADDLAAILCRALWRGRPQRIVHAADDTRLKMGDYFDAVARAYGLPPPPRISREQAEAALDPGLLSFMRESRQLDNTRQKRELRIRLRYPDVAGFLRDHAPLK